MPALSGRQLTETTGDGREQPLLGGERQEVAVAISDAIREPGRIRGEAAGVRIVGCLRAARRADGDADIAIGIGEGFRRVQRHRRAVAEVGFNVGRNRLARQNAVVALDGDRVVRVAGGTNDEGVIDAAATTGEERLIERRAVVERAAAVAGDQVHMGIGVDGLPEADDASAEATLTHAPTKDFHRLFREGERIGGVGEECRGVAASPGYH